MKKAGKTRKFGYFLEMSNIHGEYITEPSPCRSLREAVEEVEPHVQDLAHYKKIYRDFKDGNGLYIGVFFSKAETAESLVNHVIVRITAYQLLTDNEIAKALEYIERISQNEPKAVSGR